MSTPSLTSSTPISQVTRTNDSARTKSEYEFVVADEKSEHFKLVKKIFINKLETKYGSQGFNLDRFKSGRNRRCEVLLKDDRPIGLIAYLTRLEDVHGLSNSFEVKNLYVIKPKKNSGKGYGTLLLERVIKLANRKHAEGVLFPLPPEDEQLVNFLKHKDFVVHKTETDKVFLYKRLAEQSSARTTALPRDSASTDPFATIKFKKRTPDDSSALKRKRDGEESLDNDDEKVSKGRKITTQDVIQFDKPVQSYRSRSYSDPYSSQSSSTTPYSSHSSTTTPYSSHSSTTTSTSSSSYPYPSAPQRYNQYGSSSSTGYPGYSTSTSYQDPYRYSAPMPPQRSQAPSTAIHLGPNSHQLTLRKVYIHQIRKGQKTIEGRIFSGPVLKFKQGDAIRFFYQADESDDVKCRITKIEKFASFREMLTNCGFNKCLAEVRSLEQAVKVYDDIKGYTDRARQHGVAAIHLEVV